MKAALFSMPSVQRSLPSLKDKGGSLATALLALSLSMLSMKSITNLKETIIVKLNFHILLQSTVTHHVYLPALLNNAQNFNFNHLCIAIRLSFAPALLVPSSTK
jgi:hypothetical protein